MRKDKNYVYKHTDTGKYLEMCYVGDGEIYLNLVDDVTKDCIINEDIDWPLDEIIQSGDGGAEVNGTFIEFTPSDFTTQKVKIELV